jgi:hypothetical protein
VEQVRENVLTLIDEFVPQDCDAKNPLAILYQAVGLELERLAPLLAEANLQIAGKDREIEKLKAELALYKPVESTDIGGTHGD